MDVVDSDGNSVRGEVGELVCRKPFPGMTRGVLARPRALPRHVLAPLPRRLDARRLGLGRRGRLLVPARALRRHAEHRRQADRARGARVGRGRHPASSPRRRRSASRTTVKGEVAWIFCVVTPGAQVDDGLQPRSPTRSTGELGKAFKPDRVSSVSRAAEDAQREDRPAGRSRPRARHRPGRPLVARESRSLEEIANAV